MATPMEKDIEKALTRMVGRHGGKCPKWVSPGWAGVPDRICLLPGGLIIFVETKRPRSSKVAALQKKWREWLVGLGFVHRFVFTVEDLQELELRIRGIAPSQVTDEAKEVRWSKPGPCPVTPEQFDAIYNDAEEVTP